VADNVLPLNLGKTEKDELEQLRARNLYRLQQLSKEGFVLDPITMLKHRLDVVTAFVLGDDEERQVKLELAYEGTIAQLFDEVEQNINRAKLTAGLGGVQQSLGGLL
jgi:hypothetical protein